MFDWQQLTFIQKKVSLRILTVLWTSIFISWCLPLILFYRLPTYKAESLFFLASKRVDELVFFMEKQRRSVVELARSVYMQDLMSFQQGEGQITELQNKKMQSFLKEYQRSFGYTQIFLLDLEGTFVFSTIEGLILQNINKDAFKKSQLLASFEFIRMTLTSDNTDFRYDPIVKERALYITMPVSFEGKLRGILAVQLSNEKIEHILRNYAGLGTSGELVIASARDQAYTFILPPRYDKARANADHPISDDLVLPIEKAMFGYQDFGIEKDYQGVPHIAAWKFVPQYNWGLVAKVAYADYLFWLYMLQYLLFILSALLLVLTAWFVYMRKKNDVAISKKKKKRNKGNEA